MKIYESIANENLLKEFANPMGKTMMNHAFNTCGIENYLSIATVLSPKILEVNGCYFISEFYNGNIESLEQEYNFDRQKIEKHVNSWSLTDFFLLARDSSLDNDGIYFNFCKIIKYFWELWFKELFPELKFNIEIIENFMGESDMAITVYQLT
ncbi:hypothetical protein RB620_27100 [Paenibacillus sp. LHD-117]|uniref:hypothetical protein n=1 Tax=Paenibacillus sp. LHD-117 TaxID=3071412 RepID=UPI0027E06332|nr:hypothetical protein [Paenibacillus sp. LHD-117]MDQ6423103.1 hypothetical protein [Paenibacillus sp. LHD-117]